ncbi:hypothetical protein FQR65_LT20644 [Abscondita terminalis]|nr:hypothetical protein FQR65_LT20644 [Abscondita terminalis]
MISENITEQQLVQRLFSKDRAAWKEFYDSYSAGLTYVCMRYIKEPEDVRDVLQNSFVKMFHAIDTFQYKGKGALKAWSTRIVINESLQQLKSISKFEKVNTPENLPNEEEEENPDLMDIPESDILEMIRLSLPDGYRTVFNLYTVKKRYFMKERWLDDLKKKMEGHKETSPEHLWNAIDQELFSKKEAKIIPLLSELNGKSKEEKRFQKRQKKENRSSVLQRPDFCGTSFLLIPTQQVSGYAMMNGDPMDATVDSEGNYTEDPLNNIIVGNQEKQVETKIRHKTPVRMGVSLYYPLGNRWAVNTGITYTKLSSELVSGSAAYRYNSRQQLHYIGVPLQLNYTIWSAGRFTTYANMGVHVEKVVYGTLKTIILWIVFYRKVLLRRSDQKRIQTSLMQIKG